MTTQHKKIIKAVKLINANAQFGLSGDNIDDIVWEEGTTPIAKADIEARLSEAETAIANEETQKATDKANGNQKLLDLGLTQAEATALTGYTPPIED
jgi:hypothetical protein